MRSFKRFVFSIVGITLFVIMPSFFIISNHLEKRFPGNDYVVTRLTGQAFVQYRVSHRVAETGNTGGTYHRKSDWIPLADHMKIGSGALIETRKNTSLDIMKNKEVAIRIRENSRVEFNLVKAGNEMKIFIRALRYFARLRWDNRVPGSIREVKLEDGDYRDPWNTDYLYEKLALQSAILISAGPDRHFHTSDDIFMAIHLN